MSKPMPRFSPSSRLRRLAAILSIAGALGLSASLPVAAQSQLSITGYGVNRSVEVELNKSLLLDLPAEVAEVIVSQPAVAGTVMRTARRAIIQGVGAGSTNIFFLDASGRTISVLDVTVGRGVNSIGSAIETAISRIIPGSAIRVESVALDGSTNRVVLSGTAMSGDDLTRAGEIAAQFAGGAENVANLVNVAGSQQVMLAVTVAEVSRDVAKQFGINLSGTLSVGTANLSFNNPMTTVPNGGQGQFGIGSLQINAAIRALEDRGALRILAQPTLTAMSGQVAEFLAGGELPFTVLDGNGNPSTAFKPFGIELEFTPVVKSNGVIGMQVSTSVSDPQPDQSLNTRRASTSVELPSGMTLAIGGLLEERTRQEISELPGFGNLPILGALFRSREYIASQTELVILVTPHLVAPSHHIPLPTDTYVEASDAEAIFLGHMESTYGASSQPGMRGSFAGSVGFVLD